MKTRPSQQARPVDNLPNSSPLPNAPPSSTPVLSPFLFFSSPPRSSSNQSGRISTVQDALRHSPAAAAAHSALRGARMDERGGRPRRPLTSAVLPPPSPLPPETAPRKTLREERGSWLPSAQHGEGDQVAPPARATLRKWWGCARSLPSRFTITSLGGLRGWCAREREGAGVCRAWSPPFGLKPSRVRPVFSSGVPAVIILRGIFKVRRLCLITLSALCLILISPHELLWRENTNRWTN